MEETVIKQIADYARSTLEGEGSGHDWWHIHRVRNLAKNISKSEGGDLYLIESAALLHDIADWKFYDGDDTIGPRKAEEFLKSKDVSDEIITHVCDIIATISFKGAGVETPMKTIEGKIVQDSDRLDAIGAVGIARAFAYGGSKDREMYNPDEKPEMHQSFEEYKKKQSHTINHFYEKLLLLKDRMNTETAKRLAEERHKVMEEFLETFFQEWEGKK